MKIAKLITWNWGSVDNREWEFADSVLLTGESGSGKSTLLDSIQTLLTAAHHHIVQFNIGQDESTQSRKGGKEPRTLQAYALGQQADGVFLRNRSTSFVAVVFEASEAHAEAVEPFTALIVVEAHEDGGKAVLTRQPLYFVVLKALSMSMLMQDSVAGRQVAALPLKDVYLALQARLRSGSEVVQRYEDKTKYLMRVYGALMAKASVSDAEAQRAAKSIVRAMAYKELGNVNDLVRDEILDIRDFSKDLNTMRSLMKIIAGLHEAASRLKENIENLGAIESAAKEVMALTRRYVVMTVAYALRAVNETENEIGAAQRGIASQTSANASVQRRLDNLAAEEKRHRDSLGLIEAELASSSVVQRKRDLEQRTGFLAAQFFLHWRRFKDDATGVGRVLPVLVPLVSADLTAVPALAEALKRLRPLVMALGGLWESGLQAMAAATPTVVTSLPAFDVEAFDSLVTELEGHMRSGEDSVSDALIRSMSSVDRSLNELGDQLTQRASELKLLQEGKAPARGDVHSALALLVEQVPDAKPNILSSLVAPIKGSTWQNAIEGYINHDRFAIIVEPGYEAKCTRIVKRRFAKRSPKVVQGSKAIEDTRAFRPEARSIVHELEVSHPVAKAFLYALYGRTRKVDSEEELSRTATGLMEEGIGSRAYGMFACWMDDNELAFGEANRKARIAWCESELLRIQREIRELKATDADLRRLSKAISGVSLSPLALTLGEVLAVQAQHVEAAAELNAIDTSSVDSLLASQKELREKINSVAERKTAELLNMGENNAALKLHQAALTAASDRLPMLELQRTNAKVWASRFVSGAPDTTTEQQLVDEAQQEAEKLDVRLETLRSRAETASNGLGVLLREVNSTVFTYQKGARTDEERIIYKDPPRSIERMEEVLGSMIELLTVVQGQARRQASNGLAENQRSLEDAEAKFNDVFTSNFCLKVRDEVRQGATTLAKLSRELKNIQFGYDTYELDWVMLPRFQKFYDFFEAAEALADTLEKEKVSIFDSPRLSDEHRATAHSIRDLLLADDAGAAERNLKELADYRNYRRYDIIRRNKAGQTKLSTWGTGSGGELETPFYVIRSTVLAHALGHFGRDRKNAPALRLMLSDEAFSKMDESRSRSVLQFLSKTLGLQLIVAMPTSKSGAVKPEFDKEFTFSKVLASRDGHELFVSEVQEKLLKREPMKKLWDEHALRAREVGRSEFEAQRATAIASSGRTGGATSLDKGSQELRDA